MLKVAKKTYFYGEFGCLNYSILSHLERQNSFFMISTKPDYFKLMKMKCPKIEYIEDNLFYQKEHCIGSGFGFTVQHDYINKLESDGFISLKSFLGLESNRCIHHLSLLKNPLIYDIGLKDRYISVSFRNRNHERQRNISIENWTEIVKGIRKFSDLEIISHGMDFDTIPSDKFGIKKANNIEESIAYLNRSEVFIASMSGIAQFASNCACPIIQIGDPSRHFDYDPFNKGCYTTTFDNFDNTLFDFFKAK
jgi:hypothetical protein